MSKDTMANEELEGQFRLLDYHHRAMDEGVKADILCFQDIRQERIPLFLLLTDLSADGDDGAADGAAKDSADFRIRESTGGSEQVHGDFCLGL